MIIVGIDASLNGTGLSRYVHGRHDASKHLKMKIKGHPRLEKIEDGVAQFVLEYGCDLAVIEGLSYGSFDAGGQIRGMWWLITHRLWEEGIPVGIVPPANRAKYATGNGKASKADVVAAVNSDLFPGVIAENDDIADATILACMGSRQFGQPLDMVPETNWDQIKKGQWPDSWF